MAGKTIKATTIDPKEINGNRESILKQIETILTKIDKPNHKLTVWFGASAIYQN